MPSPTHTPVVLPDIWQSMRSVKYGKAITVSQSDPQTGYVCGNRGNKSINPDPLEFSKTTDGGFIWASPIAVAIAGNNCRLALNPYDINDIVLISYHCWTGCGDDDGVPYRSRDGGKTWTKLVLPPGNEASGMTTPTDPVWTPTALFVSAVTQGTTGPHPSPAHYFAASVNGGPLRWTSHNPDFGVPISSLSQGIQIFTVGSRLSAYGGLTINTHFQGIIATSSANGASLAHFMASGAVPEAISPVSNGQTLIEDNIHAYVVSTDNGQTWKQLPAIPGGAETIIMPGEQVVTPDGSVFGALAGNSNGVKSGIYGGNVMARCCAAGGEQFPV
jgi:hypothetical protein